jgi:hypothetical protein
MSLVNMNLNVPLEIAQKIARETHENVQNRINEISSIVTLKQEEINAFHLELETLESTRTQLQQIIEQTNQ